VRVFIGVILLSADWLYLAREIYPQNEKPDLLPGVVNFWFHVRLEAHRRSKPSCLQTMDLLQLLFSLRAFPQ
jgi:hypothetical protein